MFCYPSLVGAQLLGLCSIYCDSGFPFFYEAYMKESTYFMGYKFEMLDVSLQHQILCGDILVSGNKYKIACFQTVKKKLNLSAPRLSAKRIHPGCSQFTVCVWVTYEKVFLLASCKTKSVSEFNQLDSLASLGSWWCWFSGITIVSIFKEVLLNWFFLSVVFYGKCWTTTKKRVIILQFVPSMKLVFFNLM